MIMQLLPPIASWTGDDSWQLPLRESTACVLADVFVGAGELTTCLRADACLALWAVCRMGASKTAQPCSLSGIEQWLRDHLAYELQWANPLAQSRDVSTRVGEKWRELHAVSLRVAVAMEQSRADDDTSYLVGLLHAAPEWLGSCGPAVNLESRKRTCLPRWLDQVLRSSRRDRPRGLGKDLARAIAEVGGTSGDSSTAPSNRTPGDASFAGTSSSLAGFLPRLASRLRNVVELERRFAETVREQKVAALKEFAYGASHEINNPLANISTRAQALLRDEMDPERRRRLASIVHQAFRAHEMISDVMLFAKPPELQPTEVDVRSLVTDVLKELEEPAAEQRTTVALKSADAPVHVLADPVHLSVAFRALVVNSLEALRSGGEVAVWVREESPSQLGENTVSIVVADTGPGLTPRSKEHLFDPYFSGREAGRGLGLGLSKTWRIVTEHGGRIEVDADRDAGVAFTILLPREQPANTREIAS